MDVINKSKELLSLTYSLVMNEKKMPKKHRYFLGKSLYESANTIACSIFSANNIFPRTKEDFDERRSFQKIALRECALFLNKLEMYAFLLPNISYKDVEKLAMLANSIKALISGWTKSDEKQFADLP